MKELKQDSLKSLTITDYSSTTPKKQSEPIGIHYLEIELTDENDFNHDLDNSYQTKGDSLVIQFYYGNWSASVQEMKDHYIRWDDLLDYIANHELWNEEGHSYLDGHFDHAFFGELAFELGRDK